MRSQERSEARRYALEYVCGAVAGLVSDPVAHPVETLRVNLMSDGRERRFRNSWEAFIKLGSFRTLYRGFGIVGAFTLPAHGLYFSGYEITQSAARLMLPHINDTAAEFVGGMGADVFSSVLWTPMDVVSQRLQLQLASTHRYTSSMHCLRDILRTEGVRGLYVGWTAGLLTYAPYGGIYFASYAKSKQLYCRLTGTAHGDEAFVTRVAAGAIAGTAAALLTNPLEIAKTRLQVRSHGYAGFWPGVRHVLLTERMRAFSIGLGARIVSTVPAAALTIAVYEQMKRWLGLSEEHD